MLRVDLADVTHHSDKRALVRFQRIAAEWRMYVVRLPVLVGHVGKAFGVRFHPFGRIGGTSVFPGAEPQQDQADVVLPGLGDQRVQQEKSNLPSTGSICSHATGISSVLAWIALMVGQTSGSMSG